MRPVLLIFALSALATATSCRKDSHRTPAVQIIPEIRSRVSGVHFDTGDRIGLTITRSSGNFIENKELTYDGTSFSASGLLWYNNQNEHSTLTAYYPYSNQGAPTEFSVATDQRNGCATSDLLGAVKREVTPGSAPVSMKFYHLMSQLSILVNNSSDASVTSISLSGLIPTALVDLTVPTATVKTEAAATTIHTCTITEGKNYKAILVPQQGALTVTVQTSDGQNHNRTIPSALLESGKSYDLAINIANNDIALSLSADINDWLYGGWLDDGSHSNNDPGNNESQPEKPQPDEPQPDKPLPDEPQPDEPVVDNGTLQYNGESYRTKRIAGLVWMADNMRNMPAGANLGEGVWNPVGGASSVATQGLLYDYATATGGATAAESPVQGICPPGWHLPDESEVTALMQSNELGSDFLCCASFWRTPGTTAEGYGAATEGRLMSTTLNGDKCRCLKYSSVSGTTNTMASISKDYGISVRCVQNAK